MAKRVEGCARGAAQKLLRLKSELAGLRKTIEEGAVVDPRRLAVMLEEWEGCIEESRATVVDILAQLDRLQITHDKLRERIDSQSLLPRTEESHARPEPSRSRAFSAPVALPSPGESQDFSAIDAELSKLNESMLRAMSD